MTGIVCSLAAVNLYYKKWRFNLNIITPGMKFNKLTVIKGVSPKNYKSPNRPIHNYRRFLFRCDCGNEKVMFLYAVKSGHTKTCGCKLGLPIVGLSKHPLYQIYRGMLRRCFAPTDKNYYFYGAKGVTVCNQWCDTGSTKINLEKFKVFIKDVYPTYKPGMTIDRWPDNNGNYEPGNVRWATVFEQNRNKTNNRFVEYRGKMFSLINLSEQYNVQYNTLHVRIFQHGWSVERAVETPIRKRKKIIDC